MDEFSKSGYGGEAKDEVEEAARTGILRTEGGASMVVYPLCRVTLRQAIMVVTGTTVFCLEAAWEGMTEEDRERFRKAAARGTGWIDRQVDIPTLAGKLTRGGRWCAHKGYSREAKRAVRDSGAVAFGVVRPSQQSAGTIVVGGQPSDMAQYCGTCEGITEASRRCSPNGSGMEQFHSITLDLVERQLRQDMEKKVERDANRQIREEAIESDQGAEPWMTIGRQTMHRITEITDAQGWGEHGGSEDTVQGKGDGRGGEGEFGTGTGSGCYTEERWNRVEERMLDAVRENTETRKELERREKERWDRTEERWSRLEKWMLDDARKNTEVREELEKREKERWEKMLGTVQELREETRKAWRGTNEGIGELKKWLVRVGNEVKEGESIGFKNQAAVMESISKPLLNHNVSRKDHKRIYGEITTLETAMGSTVKEAVAGELRRLRWELKKIFDSLASHTPTPKENTRGKTDRQRRVGQSPDTDTDSQDEEERTASAIHKGYRGTIGRRRGERADGVGKSSERESNPIVLDTPTHGKPVIKAKGAPTKTDTEISSGEVTDNGAEGSSSEGMPGRWEVSPTVSLDPTPAQGITSPRKDLTREAISGLRDEITIGFIANEVPMEPEVSPEPVEQMPTTSETIQYDEESEEKMLRQVEEDSKKQGEADFRKEEKEMLMRVAGMEDKGKKSREGERRREAKAEEKGRDASSPELGRATAKVKEGKPEGRTGKEEEKWMKGLCDCCRENETVGRKGEDSKGKAIERSDWGEEGWREAGIQITVEGELTGEADRGETSQKAGVKKGDEGEKKKDPILINAPKGPKRLPSFCSLCRIYGHGDLTCHLQGNAPTPGPSRYQKPFKNIQQRTPRRGLGAPRGRADIPTRKEESWSWGHAKRGITFKREEKPTPPRGELELVKSNPEPGRAETGDLDKRTETEESRELRRDEPMSPELGVGRSEVGGDPGAKKRGFQTTEGRGRREREGGDPSIENTPWGLQSPHHNVGEGERVGMEEEVEGEGREGVEDG